MGSDWPDGWRTATLTDAEIPVTDFALRVLQAWADSTPMLVYTNNPLGMPAVKGKTGELLGTGYAVFATMPLFRQAFADLIKSPSGQKLYQALAMTEKYAPAYRAIHALPWPPNNTETDWPSGVLDLTSESTYRRLASVESPDDRKTSGTFGDETAFGQLQGQSSRRSAQNTTRMQQAMRAMQQSPGRMN